MNNHEDLACKMPYQGNKNNRFVIISPLTWRKRLHWVLKILSFFTGRSPTNMGTILLHRSKKCGEAVVWKVRSQLLHFSGRKWYSSFLVGVISSKGQGKKLDRSRRAGPRPFLSDVFGDYPHPASTEYIVLCILCSLSVLWYVVKMSRSIWFLYIVIFSVFTPAWGRYDAQIKQTTEYCNILSLRTE